MGPRPFFFLAAIALGWAVHLSNGAFNHMGLVWLGAAGLCLVLGVRDFEKADRSARFAVWQPRLPYLWAALLAAQLVGITTRVRPLSGPLRETPASMFVLALPLALGLGVCVWPFAPQRRCARLRVLPLLIAFLVAGAAVLARAANPRIDVYWFQHDSAAVLLAGHNPYAMTFHDIYAPHGGYYGPGVSVGGIIQYGFPYLPLSLLAVLPAYFLAGDPRYAQLVALVLAAAVIARLRPGRLGALAAATLLLSPRSLFVLNSAWTEPFAILLLALLVAAVERVPRLAASALGLFLAIKQYTIFLLPPVVLLLPAERRAWSKPIIQAACVGAAVTLPFVLWDVRAFWHSVVEWQFVQPLRRDALSYLVALTRVGVPVPVSLAFVAALMATLWSCRRLPKGGTSFAAATALTLWAFFAFNKQAFCNYYYFVSGAAVLAGLGRPPATPQAESTCA